MLNSQLSIKDTVIQTALCHPDWSVQWVVDYLDSEWWQTPDWRADVIVLCDGQSPEQTVSRWLAEFAQVRP